MRMKTRIFAGATCDQIVYSVSDRIKDPKKADDRPRFKNKEEREEFNRQRSRRKHARDINTNFKPGDLYSTLTCDEDHELHDFMDGRRERDNFVRRLLYAYPNARIYIYMGKGKKKQRIHFHMISSGIPKSAIIEKWKCAETPEDSIVELRADNVYNGVNCGADFTGLANYCFDHWKEEQGGHRYKAAGNIVKPEAERPTECVRDYSPEHPPVAPKGFEFNRCEWNKYGYMCFHYILIRKRKKKASPERGNT